MDAKHAAKAQEAGISPPVSPPDSVIVEDEPKPAVSKKCFCMIVFLVLVGGVVGILTILKREKMEKELALATSTTGKIIIIYAVEKPLTASSKK